MISDRVGMHTLTEQLNKRVIHKTHYQCFNLSSSSSIGTTLNLSNLSPETKAIECRWMACKCFKLKPWIIPILTTQKTSQRAYKCYNPWSTSTKLQETTFAIANHSQARFSLPPWRGLSLKICITRIFMLKINMAKTILIVFKDKCPLNGHKIWYHTRTSLAA